MIPLCLAFMFMPWFLLHVYVCRRADSLSIFKLKVSLFLMCYDQINFCSISHSSQKYIVTTSPSSAKLKTADKPLREEMKWKFKLRNLLLLHCFMISLHIYPCTGDSEYEDENRSCHKYIYDFIMGILNSSLTCLGGKSTFKVNNVFEYSTRASCLFKCILQEEGTIDMKNGMLDDVAAALYFIQSFSPEVREISLPIILQECFALAENFAPNEYWCKSYLPFTECSFNAILKGLIPYGGDCITKPLLGIFFSVVKYLSPDSPKVSAEMEELRRSVSNKKQIKCLDKHCRKMYEYKKLNGTQTIVMYNKDMEVIDSRPAKWKPNKNVSKNKVFGNGKNNKNYIKNKFGGIKRVKTKFQQFIDTSINRFLHKS